MRVPRLQSSGFTVVELIIIIIVMGILTSASVMGYTRMQRDGRDQQREQNIGVVVEALEKYYDKNGQYPTMADMAYANTDDKLTRLLGLPDHKSLLMPGASPSTKNSFGPGTATTTKPLYRGTPTATHCTIHMTLSDNGYCTGYSITWVPESSPASPVTVTSRR